MLSSLRGSMILSITLDLVTLQDVIDLSETPLREHYVNDPN